MSRKQRKKVRKGSQDEIARRFLFKEVVFKAPDGSMLEGVVREVKDFRLRVGTVKGRDPSQQYDIHYKDAIRK